MKKRKGIVPVAKNWTVEEGYEQALNFAEEGFEKTNYIFDPKDKKSRQGVRLHSRDILANLKKKKS